MLSLYYKIWVDALIQAQKKTGKSGNWKLLTLIPISLLNGVNLLAIFLFMRILSHNQTLGLFPIHIFKVGPLNEFISVLITYFVPFVILNYLLIFSIDQYNRLMKEYSGHEGKLYLKYAAISIGIIVVPVVFKLIF
jgi:hypothetical protein